jgi:mannose-6-phosphate isomerase-like protein (cupin superfamily)
MVCWEPKTMTQELMMSVTQTASRGDAAELPPDKRIGFQRYKLRAQLLSQGRTDTVLAQSDVMQLRLKVYASGGENGLHTHAKEDHTFLILQGRARFYDRDGEATEVGPLEGIFIPAGAFYRFEAISSEELVLFRVGARTTADRKGPDRLNVRGEPMAGDSAENKRVETIYKEGQFFG